MTTTQPLMFSEHSHTPSMFHSSMEAKHNSPARGAEAPTTAPPSPPSELSGTLLKHFESNENLAFGDHEGSWIQRLWHGPYLKVVIYAIACLTTSCVYFGWQPFSEMIFRQGAYSWLCDDDWDYAIDGVCTAQDKAVTRLYSFAQGSEFVCAFIAGLLLDHLGPRYTALAGELLFALAVLMICVSRQSFQLYIPAMIVSGGCVNIVSFPSLVVTETWPTRQALVVSIIVGAQSGASIVAPILKSIWDKNESFSYFGIWGVYLLSIWLPVSALYLLALPTRRNYAQLVKKDSLEAGTIAIKQQVGAGLEHADEDDLELNAENSQLQIEDKHASLKAVQPPTTNKEKWAAFWRDVKTIDLCVAACYLFLLMLQFAYYPSVVRDAISEEISNYVGWMTPLQAPFSIVIGFIMDYTGTCLVMYAMCASLMFVSLSAGLGPGSNGLQRTVGLLFVFMQSATYNLKYTFVNETYDPYNFGKLVGFLGIMGGIGVYVNAPIASSTNYKAIFLAYTGVAVLMTLLATFLFIRERKGINHKTMAAVQQKHRRNKQKTEEAASSEPPQVLVA